MPESPEYSQRRYIGNSKTRQAYHMDELPSWFKQEIIDHKIIWYSYSSEKVLKSYMIENFSPIGNVASPKGLGLENVNGEWKIDKQDSELLKKLHGQKLEYLQIANLERLSFFGKKKRVLLVDFDEKKIWQAPECFHELVDYEIVSGETYRMGIFDNCKRWSKKEFGFEFFKKRYPESKLIVKKITGNS